MAERLKPVNGKSQSLQVEMLKRVFVIAEILAKHDASQPFSLVRSPHDENLRCEKQGKVK